jgi:chaperonin GroES
MPKTTVPREREGRHIMICFGGNACISVPARPCRRASHRSRGKTAGGIIIPDTAKEKPQEGEVVAVGPGARDETGKLVELSVKAGDRVLFGKWSGSEVKIDGEELLIMKESDILGIVETEASSK